jgi:FAD/FMN-containing dehydrogenase
MSSIWKGRPKRCPREILIASKRFAAPGTSSPMCPAWKDFARAARSLSWQGALWCNLGSTREIAEVLKLCHETATPVVPQGGNSRPVGQIPRPRQRRASLAA